MSVKTGTVMGYTLIGFALIVYFTQTGGEYIPLLYCSALICLSIGGISE